MIIIYQNKIKYCKFSLALNLIKSIIDLMRNLWVFSVIGFLGLIINCCFVVVLDNTHTLHEYIFLTIDFIRYYTSSRLFSSSAEEFPFSIFSSVFASTSSSVELPPLSALESTLFSENPFSSAETTSSSSSLAALGLLPRLPPWVEQN